MNNTDDEVNEEEHHGGYLCTQAITGTDRPAYQAIYVCETCQSLPRTTDAGDEYLTADGGGDVSAGEASKGQMRPIPTCICECCAEVCHADHDVSFVGMGASTCDCPSLVTEPSTQGGGVINLTSPPHVCHLVETSIEEAERLGFSDHEARLLNDPIPLMIPPIATLPMPPASFIKPMHEEDAKSQWLSSMCIECESSMCGYSYGAFTLPCLSGDVSHGRSEVGNGLCQSLIRQAEVLAECSRETFWAPMGEEDHSDANGPRQWCDLEILAREIYKQHVKAYGLDDGIGQVKSDGGANTTTKAGVEWWVQVKPAGSTRAPVDLHYDKDEALAESFSLGSFPTLSTVTYLTGETGDYTEGGRTDQAPTVVFPHTYNDEEDQPIPMMLLSHAVRGKHIVFDGRLLHGAPGHLALRRSKQSSKATTGAGDDSSLRVTFLVNIWKTGKPAGVHVLPNDIRSKVQAVGVEVTPSSPLLGELPIQFQPKTVLQFTAPSKLAASFSMTTGSKIVLPFVSHGATWISDDEGSGNGKDDEQKVGATVTAGYKTTGDEEGEDDDEGDELVLVLPQFATPEYTESKSDTSIFHFEVGNEARLVRGDVDVQNPKAGYDQTMDFE